MKILFLAAANSVHTVKWVNSLAELGHKVFLIYNEDHRPMDDLINKKVRLISLKFSGSMAYYLNAPQLKRVVKKISPDVINVHYASGYGTLARWARLSQYLLSVWGSDVYDFPYRSKIKKIILKKNVRKASFLASTSFCMAQQLKKVMENNDLEIAITPFGVDLELFNPSKYENKSKNSEFIIGNIKALEEIYGIKELIEAFEKLQNKLVEEKVEKKVSLYIYGDGSQKKELQQLIRKKNLENKVKLKGKIPNVEIPGVLGQFDIFCALSYKESFGVAVVEAMAMEKPVIVSEADGFKEVVVDNETGLIVPWRDIDEVVEKMMILILDQDKARKMGENGRHRVEKLYNWRKNVDYMVELYEKVKS